MGVDNLNSYYDPALNRGRLIEVLEACLGRPAVKVFLPLQAGEVVATYADVAELMTAVGFRPQTEIEAG